MDQLRAGVPAEVREAQEVLNRKEEVLAQAEEEVALRLARADKEVERRVSESEVTVAAKARAEEIVARGRTEAERSLEEAQRQVASKRAEEQRLASEQMSEADRYALEMLRKLETQLNAFMTSVRSGIQALERNQGEVAARGEDAPRADDRGSLRSR